MCLFNCNLTITFTTFLPDQLLTSGAPCWIGRLHFGRPHDKRIWVADQPLLHPNELILGDLGFYSSRLPNIITGNQLFHLQSTPYYSFLSPSYSGFKRPNNGHLTIPQRVFNVTQQRWRSRIEHYWSFLK